MLSGTPTSSWAVGEYSWQQAGDDTIRIPKNSKHILQIYWYTYWSYLFTSFLPSLASNHRSLPRRKPFFFFRISSWRFEIRFTPLWFTTVYKGSAGQAWWCRWCAIPLVEPSGGCLTKFQLASKLSLLAQTEHIFAVLLLLVLLFLTSGCWALTFLSSHHTPPHHCRASSASLLLNGQGISLPPHPSWNRPEKYKSIRIQSNSIQCVKTSSCLKHLNYDTFDLKLNAWHLKSQGH